MILISNEVICLSEGERYSRRTAKRSKNNKKKKKKFKIIKIIFLIIIALGVIGSSAVGVMTYNVIQNTEPIDPNNIYSLLNENSFIYDQEGNVIEKVQSNYDGLRTNVKFNDIPEDLLNAFIAIEDKTFWEHKGFNIVRIFGAIWEGLSSGENIRGTSTITQQLARNLYLAETKSERSLDRKIKEAYYALLLEKSLSKKQIIEAYLNTIYLGFGANGVQAASQEYFSKDIDELSLPECALIAGITKNPSKFAPIKRLRNEDIDPADPNIINIGETYTLLYDDRFRDRQLVVLKMMLENNFISQEQYDDAIDTDMRNHVNPSFSENKEISSYFIDKVKSDALSALINDYGASEKEAHDMLYKAGLKIYSTIDMKLQRIVETEFDDSSNFPNTRASKDNHGNILDKQYRIMLHKYDNLFNHENAFVLQSSDYNKDASGNLVLMKNKKLLFNSYKENDEIIDIKISIKDYYKDSDGFTITKGSRLMIPNTYKELDSEGNVVISKQFLQDNPEFFVQDGENYLIQENNLNLSEEVMQPQSAMVIIDPHTGEIKALVGGRNISGKLLYSRATNPSQPGSSIKPLAVYTPALDNGWTAASIIDDAPLFNKKGEVWPRNWYTGFKGLVTLRYAVEQSINVAAVKVSEAIGVETSKSYLKDFGVTSIIEEGSFNDNNSAALALGGMTRGISPLEMTAAYGTLANKGVYNEPISFTRIEDKNGNVILENIPERHTVVDEDVAFMMTDILVSSVRYGTGSRASIFSGNTTIPIAGKTGTTSSNYDAWFMGYSPYYVGGLWIGNDLDIELSQGSTVSAQLWSKIMKQVHENLPAKEFERPSNIIRATVDNKSGKVPTEISHMDPRQNNIISEYFISGSQPTEYDDIHVLADIDIFTNRLATPSCPQQFVEQKVYTRRPYPLIEDPNLFPEDYIYEMPRYYCPLHNPSYQLYPTDIEMDSDYEQEQNGETDFDFPSNDNEINDDIGEMTDNENSTETEYPIESRMNDQNE